MAVADFQIAMEQPMEEPVSPTAFALLEARVKLLEKNYETIEDAIARIENKLGKVIVFVALLSGGAGIGANEIIKTLFGAE